MLCEMCGKTVDSTARVRLEGTVLRLCPECARFGEAVDPVPAPPAPVVPARAPFRPGAPPRPAGRGRRLAERDLYEEIGEPTRLGDAMVEWEPLLADIED